MGILVVEFNGLQKNYFGLRRFKDKENSIYGIQVKSLSIYEVFIFNLDIDRIRYLW